MLGVLEAMVGDPVKAIAICRRAVERAPEAYEHALALGWLGYALLENGDHAEAVAGLEEADRKAVEYRSLQIQALFKAYLGDAYLAVGRLDDAQALSSRAREISGEVGYPYGTALATRTLGRIAHAQGSAGAGRALLDEGDAPATESWLREAHALFSRLGASRDVARTEELARSLGHPDPIR